MAGRGYYRFCVICRNEFYKEHRNQVCCSPECMSTYRKALGEGQYTFRHDLMSVVSQLFTCAVLIDKYGNPEIIGWEEWRNNRRADIVRTM